MKIMVIGFALAMLVAISVVWHQASEFNRVREMWRDCGEGYCKLLEENYALRAELAQVPDTLRFKPWKGAAQ